MTLLARLADVLVGPAEPPAGLPGAPLPPGVRVRRNRLVPALGGLLGRMGGPAAAVTLGRTILVHPSVRIDEGLLVHEMVHVEQWTEDRLFPVKYTLESLRRGYRGNRYEVEAYEREHRFRARHTNTPPRNP